jgi:hypothetical protein
VLPTKFLCHQDRLPKLPNDTVKMVATSIM